MTALLLHHNIAPGLPGLQSAESLTPVAVREALLVCYLLWVCNGLTWQWLPFFSSLAWAANDPALELFHIRCQIDIDVNPDTGLSEPKVQIQAKARADILDGQAVVFWVENRSSVRAPPASISTTFELGSAAADWDTFPDPLDPNPVTTVSGDFLAAGEIVEADANRIRLLLFIASANAPISGTRTHARFAVDLR
jgi:hypothetical protein